MNVGLADVTLEKCILHLRVALVLHSSSCYALVDRDGRTIYIFWNMPCPQGP